MNDLTHIYQLFCHAWRTGEWDPFIETIHGDCIFQYPAGRYQGRHLAPTGAIQLTRWARSHVQQNDRITITPQKQFIVGDWGIFTQTSSGQEDGISYNGNEAIFLRVQAGKLIEYREYIGDITDWIP